MLDRTVFYDRCIHKYFDGEKPRPRWICRFIKLWDTIGEEFVAMLNDSIRRGALPQGMNKGLIVLLHKGGNREERANWRPVTLLNVPYKILAKALQRRIQPLMAEIIHENQTGFIPMRYIIDNVLLQHKLIEWSRESWQDMLLLKSNGFPIG